MSAQDAEIINNFQLNIENKDLILVTRTTVNKINFKLKMKTVILKNLNQFQTIAIRNITFFTSIFFCKLR